MDTNPDTGFEKCDSADACLPPRDRSAVLIVVPFLVALTLALVGGISWVLSSG